jgi:hypothetical protein
MKLPVFAIIAIFASSMSAEAFLGLTRGQVKERLGDPEAKIVEVNAEKYMINNHAYIIRYDAAGAVDRCMIAKMTDPDTFTPQEFNDLTKSIASTGFKTLKSDADACLMVNHDTNNAYLAQRSGARKDWVVMTTYKVGGQPDLTFFKEVMRLLSGK